MCITCLSYITITNTDEKQWICHLKTVDQINIWCVCQAAHVHSSNTDWPTDRILSSFRSWMEDRSLMTYIQRTFLNMWMKRWPSSVSRKQQPLPGNIQQNRSAQDQHSHYRQTWQRKSSQPTNWSKQKKIVIQSNMKNDIVLALFNTITTSSFFSFLFFFIQNPSFLSSQENCFGWPAPPPA